MSAKRYLSQARWLDQIIENKIEQKEQLESLAERVTVGFTGVRVSGGTGTVSPMEDAAVKLIMIKEEINAAITRAIDLKQEIQETINKVHDFRYKMILEMRYINSKDWAEIAASLQYDEKYAMRLHGRALKEIDKILKVDT